MYAFLSALSSCSCINLNTNTSLKQTTLCPILQVQKTITFCYWKKNFTEYYYVMLSCLLHSTHTYICMYVYMRLVRR